MSSGTARRSEPGCPSHAFERGLTSIIVPTRNRARLLGVLVDSLIRSLGPESPPAELLVINNASDEPEAKRYLDSLPALAYSTSLRAVRVIDYPKPFNYSAINNLAAEHAHGEYLCFLNNDMQVVEDRWLSEMLEPFAKESTGCVGGVLLYEDSTIQHAGIVIGVETIAGHIYKHAPISWARDCEELQQTRAVSAVTGALLLVRRSVFETVGGFDERLAVSFNDVDFCLKVEQIGFRNLVVPGAIFHHFESQSRGTRKTRTRAQRKLHRREVAYMQGKWGARLLGTPEELVCWAHAQRQLRPLLSQRTARPGSTRRGLSTFVRRKLRSAAR